MYDAAQDAFTLAINTKPALIEAHVGKMLACEPVLWWQTNYKCGLEKYNFINANLAAAYPNETDIRVLWGLSLLNVAFEKEFQGEIEPPPMIQARQVLQEALIAEPMHPSALHYLMHAYDVVQYNISIKALDYVSNYEKLVGTLSYPQHLLSYIWMRTGSLLKSESPDEKSLQVCLTSCILEVTGQIVNVPSTKFEPVLAQLHTADQFSPFVITM
ncbi:unnamed protein product [Rotaria magnacalcarata]|uniref:Uncharacterized protein n=3 Tax=Rotaria magnacalcarata TaxID=392030 RepID=A0A816YW23_9BILA|nr:unnamed protein product [Rotaria magnacalcarata]